MTFDLLTWISIGIIYSWRIICLPSLKLVGQSVPEFSVAQGSGIPTYRPTDIPTCATQLKGGINSRCYIFFSQGVWSPSLTLRFNTEYKDSRQCLIGDLNMTSIPDLVKQKIFLPSLTILTQCCYTVFISNLNLWPLTFKNKRTGVFLLP